MENPTYKKKSEDLFWKTLRQEVNAYFIGQHISTKANAAMYIKAAFFIIMTVAVYIIIVFGQLSALTTLSLLVLLALLVGGVGFNVSHDALHGSFSKHNLINRALGLTMDLVGPNGYIWKLNHNAHHSHTNIHGLDGDIKDSGLIRLCPYAPYRKLHKFQVITAMLIYSSFYILIVYVFNFINILGKNFKNNRQRKHPAKQILLFTFYKLLYVLIWILVPIRFMNITVMEFMMGYFLFCGIVGLILSLIFFLAHNVESTDFVKQSEIDKPISWAEHQLRTTSNFRTGRLMSFYLGGLNYQVEHHLFPGISSIHYSKISPIIMRVAHQFNMPYHMYDNFRGAIKSHVRLLSKLSKE